MAIDKTNLKAGVRTCLLSLQRTTDLIDIVQTRLPTGLEVNSAVDDTTDVIASLEHERIAELVACQRVQVDDPLMTAILDEIELRARMAIAKFGRGA